MGESNWIKDSLFNLFQIFFFFFRLIRCLETYWESLKWNKYCIWYHFLSWLDWKTLHLEQTKHVFEKKKVFSPMYCSEMVLMSRQMTCFRLVM